MKIALSGASGFIGTHLKSLLDNTDSVETIYITREPSSANNIDCEYSFKEFLSGSIDVDIDCFIHLASPNYDYCKDDSLEDGIVGLTRDIVKSLPKYNCKKFIFFSSSKVYGESSLIDHCFQELSELNPISDYAKAKARAEILVKDISDKLGIDFLIYRLPFVYGSGMQSNIASLLNILDKSLPIISFKNNLGLKKSFLSTENIKLIIEFNLRNLSSIDSNTYNISDLEAISLDSFLKEYRILSSSKSLIINLPRVAFNFFIKMPLISSLLIKVFGSLQIDNSKIRRAINIQLSPTSDGILYLINKKNL